MEGCHREWRQCNRGDAVVTGNRNCEGSVLVRGNSERPNEKSTGVK